MPSWPFTLTRVSAPLYSVRTAFMMSGGRLKACSTSIMKVCCRRSKAFALSNMSMMPPSAVLLWLMSWAVCRTSRTFSSYDLPTQ